MCNVQTIDQMIVKKVKTADDEIKSKLQTNNPKPLFDLWYSESTD